MQMVSIPGGTFTMGCTSEQTNCYSDELPTHQVTLSSYSIGKYEITQKQWREVMGTNPSYFTGDNKPVEQVSWYEVVAFCNALSIREGFTPAYTINGTTVSCNFLSNGYRLPTEAEWEYAARGGAQSPNTQYSGSNMLSEVAWYNSNSSSTTHDVGTKLPNQLGIYDMSGNVWEWVWDYSGSYTSASQTNPTGPTSGSDRRLRGGSWNNNAENCRSANRNNNNPDNRNNNNGARVLNTKKTDIFRIYGKGVINLSKYLPCIP
jgi:formylglycine-generating enzyme required for sulfatase activity